MNTFYIIVGVYVRPQTTQIQRTIFYAIIYHYFIIQRLPISVNCIIYYVIKLLIWIAKYESSLFCSFFFCL